jgi:hypothetical protein
MRIESSITSISWIPSEAVRGTTRLPFEMNVAHYDDAPPDKLGATTLEDLRQNDGFRFANRLCAWIEVEDGRIAGYGQEGGGVIGSTTLVVGSRSATFAAVALDDIRPEPEVSETSVRFTQIAGGRTGVPAPRRVSHPPFVQIAAPTAWTTVELTLNADGTTERRLAGASPFPRHWIYDGEGVLESKSGLIDFAEWYRHAFGKHSPWGDEDSPALATAVESALERELSSLVMRGASKPDIKKLKPGKVLMEQGTEGDRLALVLDGVVAVQVDGEPLAELGPGAVVGERAVLEGGKRTATVAAVTKCTVATIPAADVDRDALERLAEGHHREDG